jgi:hypothetical protein
MSRRQSSIPARYFDDLYAGERDPWEFETSAYEQAKYDATLAALPRPRYRRGLEIGCSIGVLTARLAGRCGSLVAITFRRKRSTPPVCDAGRFQTSRSRLSACRPNGRWAPST